LSLGRDLESTVGFPKWLPEEIRHETVDQLLTQTASNHIDREQIRRGWNKYIQGPLVRAKLARNERAFYDSLREFATMVKPPLLFWSPRQRNIDFAGFASEFGGLGGLSIPNPSGGQTLLWVYRDSPLARAGIRPRDTLLTLNDRPCLDPALLRGQPGSNVRLTVRSPGGLPRSVSLQRGVVTNEIRLRVETMRQEPRVLYLFVNEFPDEATLVESLAVRLREAIRSGVGRIILDLRGNAGGNSISAERVLGFFAPGEAYRRYDDVALAPQTVNVKIEPPDLSRFPVAVLIDGQTSTLALLVAQAIRARGNAVIIGSKVNANGLLYSTMDEFSDQSVAQYPLTVVVPLGLSFAYRWGLEPDVLSTGNWLDSSESNDPDIAAALRWYFPK
jgi:carboxyl-terminal processing protease